MAEALLQAIISGLAVGGAYALVALGFSITFTTTKTLNFSHGEFVSAGAFIGMSALFLMIGVPVTSTSFGEAVPGSGAQLLALVTTLTAALYNTFSFERLALSSLFILWVALTSAAMLCGLRHTINRMPLGWAGMVVVMVVVVDAFCFSLLAGLALEWMVDGLWLDRRVWLREAFISAAIAAIIGGLVMRYFYVQEQLRLKDEAALQARIQALQSRIRPHFLFNSMNIIASLISVDPEAAEQAVEDLSRLFRASLGEAGSMVTLEQELSLVRRYIRIEQLRMGERLRVEWDIRVDTNRITILRSITGCEVLTITFHTNTTLAFTSQYRTDLYCFNTSIFD